VCCSDYGFMFDVKAKHHSICVRALHLTSGSGGGAWPYCVYTAAGSWKSIASKKSKWTQVVVAVYCNVLQCAALCCSVLWRMALLCLYCRGLLEVDCLEKKQVDSCGCCNVLQSAVVCCGVLRCAAVCCSVLQCVSVCWGAWLCCVYTAAGCLKSIASKKSKWT